MIIDRIEIIAEGGAFSFAIDVNGHAYCLARTAASQTWLISHVGSAKGAAEPLGVLQPWIGRKTLRFPDAIARALYAIERHLTGQLS